MTISDWELRSCAQHIIDRNGDGAADHVFGRIVELAKQADEEGIAAWQAIAERIEKLIETPGAGTVRH